MNLNANDKICSRKRELAQAQIYAETADHSLVPQRSAGRGLGRGAFDLLHKWCESIFNRTSSPRPSPPLHGGEGEGARKFASFASASTARSWIPEADAFTLIEICLAIAISAVVLIAINTLFFGALRLRDRVTDAAAQSLPMDNTIAVMKRDLMNIVPVGVLAGPMGTDAVAPGMTQTPTLEIYTADGEVGADQPWGDIQRIDYALQSPTNKANYAGRDLVRGVTRNLLAANPMPPEPQTLLHDVQNLQFTYYDGTNWNDTWSTSLSNIPVAIRVLIEFNNPPGAMVRSPLQFTVPVSTWSGTNSITNLVSN